MKTVAAQVTVKDGWRIMRGWIFTLDDDGKPIDSRVTSFKARLIDNDDPVRHTDYWYAGIEGVKQVLESKYGCEFIGENLDYRYHPDTGVAAAALIHYTHP